MIVCADMHVGVVSCESYHSYETKVSLDKMYTYERMYIMSSDHITTLDRVIRNHTNGRRNEHLL